MLLCYCMKRISTERIDATQWLYGRRIHNESYLLPGHKKRIAKHIKRVHHNIGPIPRCTCKECQTHKRQGTCGQHHIEIPKDILRTVYRCRCNTCQCIRAINKIIRRVYAGYEILARPYTRKIA